VARAAAPVAGVTAVALLTSRRLRTQTEEAGRDGRDNPDDEELR